MFKFLSVILFMSFMHIACALEMIDVVISEAWVRETKPGQEVGAAYMTLTSSVDAALVKAEADVAGSVEIHSMTMNNGVMRMRMLEKLELKAGKSVELAPGGFHLMLFDLKSPLKVHEKIAFKLHFKTAKGEDRMQIISVPIKATASEHSH